MERKNLAEKDHWRLLAINQRLRAVQAEMAQLQVRYQALEEERRRGEGNWKAALAEVGKALKAKGDPEKWRVYLDPENPENSYLEFPSGGDEK